MNIHSGLCFYFGREYIPPVAIIKTKSTPAEDTQQRKTVNIFVCFSNKIFLVLTYRIFNAIINLST
jgi:hypothetical protein